MTTKIIYFIAALTLTVQTTKAEPSGASREEVEAMIEGKIQDKGISNEKIIDALKSVPLEEFTNDFQYDQLFAGESMPIDFGQFVFAPHMYADMLTHANVQPDDRILDLGKGTGYFAAVLAVLCKEVYTMETIEPLAEQAKQRLSGMGYSNVYVEHGDGMLGMQGKAPFDKIFITFPVDKVPQNLVDQLKQGGRVVMLQPGADDKIVGYIKSDQGLIQIQP